MAYLSVVQKAVGLLYEYAEKFNLEVPRWIAKFPADLNLHAEYAQILQEALDNNKPLRDWGELVERSLALSKQEKKEDRQMQYRLVIHPGKFGTRVDLNDPLLFQMLDDL